MKTKIADKRHYVARLQDQNCLLWDCASARLHVVDIGYEATVD